MKYEKLIVVHEDILEFRKIPYNNRGYIEAFLELAESKVKNNGVLPVVIRRLFCKHKYELVNQFEMKSEFDIVVEAGKVPNTHNSQTRRIITDYECIKCNKIKRLTAKTPS